jgi:hypothetical protein
LRLPSIDWRYIFELQWLPFFEVLKINIGDNMDEKIVRRIVEIAMEEMSAKACADGGKCNN